MSGPSKECFHRMSCRLIENQISHTRYERRFELEFDTEIDFTSIADCRSIDSTVATTTISIITFFFGLLDVRKSPFRSKIAKQIAMSTASSDQSRSCECHLTRVSFQQHGRNSDLQVDQYFVGRTRADDRFVTSGQEAFVMLGLVDDFEQLFFGVAAKKRGRVWDLIEIQEKNQPIWIRMCLSPDDPVLSIHFALIRRTGNDGREVEKWSKRLLDRKMGFQGWKHSKRWSDHFERHNSIDRSIGWLIS